jgi:protein-tyrosine phosphatase
MSGRIDVHAHLLPGVDDGCVSLDETLACARMLVSAGYTHAFCTPHIWPGFPGNTTAAIARWTAELQPKLDAAAIPLRLLPGGEINLQAMWPAIASMPASHLPTYAMAGRHVLIDFWGDKFTSELLDGIRHLQSLGMTVIIAHPERIGMFQKNPFLAERVLQMGVLLQGNLQCFSDPPNSPCRITAERFLRDDCYFLLGSDCHMPDTLPMRLDGLERIIGIAGPDTADRLTIHNPRELLPVQT